MKRAHKVSNVHGEDNIKQKAKHCLLLEIHCPTENSHVKEQKISLLITFYAINMRLYQN